MHVGGRTIPSSPIGQTPIAIVGAACRLPGANSLRAFADVLFGGRDAVTHIPESRWNKARYFHPTPGQPGKTYTFAAGCLDHVDRFDAAFFGISRREAGSVDPHQLLLLELAHEAIEDAGIPFAALAGSATGVYVGGSSWDFVASTFTDAAALDAWSMQGAALSSLSNRISYWLGLRGPSLTVDTACSSSLVALHLACDALHRGDIGTAIVGGINLLLTPQSFVGFARASMLSPTGRCHAFDARADGYVRAEGGGAVVLKPLVQALADCDAIRAVIRGSGTNSDGHTNGFSLPSGEAQAALLQRVYAEAGVAPDDLCYFEAHGTGTPVGDPIEASAIGLALARHRASPLPIGSVKSNVGHLEAASGMAALMKVILAFEHGIVPRSLHFATPNPNIPFADLNLSVTAEAIPLAPGPAGTIAGINSFGFGGANAHVILAARQPRPAPAADTAEPPPLLLSARCTEALRSLAEAWRDRLAEALPPLVPAMLRGAARHRETHAHRLVVTASPPAVMAARLQAWLDTGRADNVASGQATQGGLAFVFSGNGSQWAGMARDALAHSPTFRDAFAEVDALLAGEFAWSATRLLNEDNLATTLRDTSVAQPLLFAIQVASVMALRQQGIEPAACIGHSAGEVAAAWAAGALSLPQASHIITQRSLAQQATHGTGVMAALGLAAPAAEALFAREHLALCVAALNGSRSVTVAGPRQDMLRLQQIAAGQDWPFTRLDLDYAFHSQAMDPIRAPLLHALHGTASAEPAIPLLSTVTGNPVTAAELDADYWWRNVRLPVQFQSATARAIDSGIRIFLEIGPLPVLQPFLRDALAQAGQPGQALATLTRNQAASDPFPLVAANCHVAGASLANAAMFNGAANVRALPAYPWQRQLIARPRTVERVDLCAPVRDHPLIGFRENLTPDAWMSHLSTATDPWLADHQVGGVTVLPAAAMIEMALATARARHDDAPALEIQDFEIARMLTLEPGTTRDCRVHVTAEGKFDLASRPRLSEEPPASHATGRILPGTSAQPLLSPLAINATGEVIEATAVYAIAEALRLHYGPQFRTVSRVLRLDPRHAIADLVACAPDRTASGYLLDPALLDGCLQALLVIAADQPHLAALGTVVPWRFGRVRLLRPLGARPCRADMHLRHIGPRSLCADIALLDSANEIVAELLECWFIPVPDSKPSRPGQIFWTAHVPAARQPHHAASPLRDHVLAALPPASDDPPSALLADAFATAAAFETLSRLASPRSGLLPTTAVTALGWLRDDGLATLDPDGWRLASASDLPPSQEIWRSLFFDTPQAVAECTLLAGLGPLLGSEPSPALQLPPSLREQILFASPSGETALQALLTGLDAVSAHWPAGRCLRIAATGALSSTCLRRITERVALHGIPLRLTALASDPQALAPLCDGLVQIPGAAAITWQDAAPHSFDLVLNLYGLSMPDSGRVAPTALAGLLAPGGLLLAAEPTPSRVAGLLFGHATASGGETALQDAPAWCDALRHAGLAVPRGVPLRGAVWPLCLLVAEANSEPTPPRQPVAPDLVVFAVPEDCLAEALAARHGVLRRRPIEALKDALSVPLVSPPANLLLLAPGTAEDDNEIDLLIELLAEISAALLQMPPAQMDSGQTARLWLACRGAPGETSVSAALTGLRRVAANELAGVDCRILHLDDTMAPETAVDRLLQELREPDAERPDTEREVWLTASSRMVPRLRLHPPAPMPDAGPRRLEVTRPGLISSLAWLPAPTPTPSADQVAIEVCAAGLNFRDVMWAQGLLPDEALLEGFSGPSLGLECAGIVTAVGPDVTDLAPGDRVIAVASAALATHVVTPRNAVLSMPDGLDFAAAATIPVAFMTAVYALGHLARIEPGERVLIHGGAGGVGLAAIQYALHRGAEVYATAGSPMRRDMLRQLGVAGAFDSRAATFVDDVLLATGSAGVDVVLNSLSGELMQQSLRLLRPFGRFLEIGKRDLYANTAVGIRSMRHNASYFAIDSDELLARRPAVAQAVLQELSSLLRAGSLRPLPYRTFGFADVQDAFRLLQSSGHIGKVLLLPEPTPAQAATPPTFSADPGAAYIVTGGLSGFGLETAAWLARHGATRLALIGRRGAATPGAAEALSAFAEQGVRAEAFACDVGDTFALANVLTHVRITLGPIRGVLHAAMVLDDAALGNTTAPRFAAVIRPKLAGALALDRLTRQDTLDLFVLFSSVTTVIGTPGQASYVAANATIEALAQRRHAAGLPALAVQWGPIGDAGYLVRERRVSDMLSTLLGSTHLHAAAALDALPSLLACGRPVVGLADLAWSQLGRHLPAGTGPFWSEMPVGRRADEPSQSIRARIASLPPQDAHQMVLDTLLEELSAILRQSPATLDVNRPVLDFGVDSLMAVELRTALEIRLGVQLPLMLLSGATTLRAMAGRLLATVQTGDPAHSEAPDDVTATILRHEGARAPLNHDAAS